MKRIGLCAALIIFGLFVLIEIYLKTTSYIYISHYKALQNPKINYEAARYELELQQLATCAGLPSIDLVVLPPKSQNKIMDLMMPDKDSNKSFTIISGFYDLLAKSKIPIIVSEEEFKKEKKYFPFMKTVAAHELAHHLLEPTIYHMLLFWMIWPAIISESKEDLVNVLANDEIYSECNFPKKSP